MQTSALLLYCRPGFEGECAAEIQERAAAEGFFGYCKTKANSGYLLFVPQHGAAADALALQIPFDELIFARQLCAAAELVRDLPVNDRIRPLLQCVDGEGFGDLRVEYPDTNDGKALSTFTRKFESPLRRALEAEGLLLNRTDLPRLHLFFLNSSSVYPARSWPTNASPHPLGIPRLKFPRAAPSRSTLKLEEALQHFLSDEDRARRLQPGMRAVDLGAAPGGWTYQLVRRSLWVTAVDNGPMDPQLLESGLVEHRREDGLRYRPLKPVDWMVCDIVEQPIRIARMVAEWVAEGHCRETIFNLKLPMKKRWQEVQRCDAAMRAILDASGRRYRLRYKQLYHDREEVTGHLHAI